MITYIIIFCSLALSAFFSGMEIAFISANRLRIELDKKQERVTSKIVSIFVKNPSRYIATMLVGNNIALVIYGVFMAILLEPYILKVTSGEYAVLLIQTLISTIIILFSAEFLPKVVFRLNPNLSLNVFSAPVLLFYILFYPISQMTIAISNFFLKHVFKKNMGNNIPVVFGKIDLASMLDDAGSDVYNNNVEVDNDVKLFQNALDFSSLKVRDCMIPRTEIVAVEKNVSISELKQKFISTGFSKVLVYEENFDNIIGYINLKELFKNPDEIASRIIKISYVPETMSTSKLLRQFIQEHKSIAVVVDEFGGISGMLTIEDIIEEIFGEIEDEHDSSEFIERKVSENQYIFSGRLEIGGINEKYQLNIPESEEYDTLAGYIIYHHEKIPDLNEIITISNFQFKMLKVTATKIVLIHLKIQEPE